MGSSIEKLVTTLYETHNVKLIGVCQTLLGSAPVFNTRVRAFNKYVKTFLEALPYDVVWEQWTTVHLNRQGQYKLFRSLRGAVLKS